MKRLLWIARTVLHIELEDIAFALDVSPRGVYRLNNIDRHHIPALKKLIREALEDLTATPTYMMRYKKAIRSFIEAELLIDR